jgi:hypothetical protein
MKKKERNPLVPIMRTHCKAGAFMDKKKQASRNACREDMMPEKIEAYECQWCGEGPMTLSECETHEASCPENDETCSTCNGSGEGQTDGST